MKSSSSRLFQKIREENGIAYQINFVSKFFLISPTFGVYLLPINKSVYKAQDLIFKEIEKIKQKKVGEIELSRAKEYLIGNMLMSLESTTNRMLRIAQSVIYFNKIKSVEETVKHIQSVTVNDIREMSNELFESTNKFENGGLTRVILSSKNILRQKVA